MRGIRQIAAVPIPRFGAPELEMACTTAGRANAQVVRTGYFVPPEGQGAEMLEGSREVIVDKLMDLLKAKGGLN